MVENEEIAREVVDARKKILREQQASISHQIILPTSSVYLYQRIRHVSLCVHTPKDIHIGQSLRIATCLVLLERTKMHFYLIALIPT